MKILMLTPYLPFPLLSGGQTRSYNLIKYLSRKHEITLFSFIRSEEEKKYIPHLKQFCHKVYIVQRRPARSIINIILTACTPYPFLVCLYLSWILRRMLKEELKTGQFDLIHAETFYVMPNIPHTTIPILLVEQTIEYRVYMHFVRTNKKIFTKPLLWLDVLKVKFWEKYFWKRATRVVAMSYADKLQMKKLDRKLHVNIVPNGVDTEYFSPKHLHLNSQPTILYVGNFKWLQNREAVDILIHNIWPGIKKEIPNARLLIVGRGQIHSLKQSNYRDITFDETVSDIRKSYAQAHVMLAPIEGPGGTRLKILEALASGCPVITTPVGIEGIAAKNGKEVLVCKSVEELIKTTVHVLRNKPLRTKLRDAGYQFVAKNYNWSNIGTKLDNIYREVGYVR